MLIQERLDELSPYVTAIQYSKIPIIEAAFPKSWGVQEHQKIAVKPIEGDNKLIFNCIVYSELDDVSIDDVLDYIGQTILINKEREAKKVLLKHKVEELKVLFNANSLTKLGDLYFGFSEEDVEDELELELELEPDKVKEEESEVIEEGVVTNAELDKRIKQKKKEEIVTKVELPPRKPVAPVLEEFVIPTCNCGQGQSCPECTDY